MRRARRTSSRGSRRSRRTALHADVQARVAEARAAFAAALQHDLNTAAALGVLFDLVRALNTAIDEGRMGREDAAAVRDAFALFDRVLGVLSLRRAEDARPPVDADGDRAPGRRPQGRAPQARLRGRRPHP